MGNARKNAFRAATIEADSIVNISSTTTTSITVVTAITSTNSTASTSVTITSQTIYFSLGQIIDLATATTTSIIDA